MQREYKSWRKAFWSQLKVALSLHTHIRTIVVADHLHCGAYKKLYLGYESDMVAAHEHITRSFSEEVKSRHPGIKVERWLLTPTPKSDLNWQAKNLDTTEVVIPCRDHFCEVAPTTSPGGKKRRRRLKHQPR